MKVTSLLMILFSSLTISTFAQSTIQEVDQMIKLIDSKKPGFERLDLSVESGESVAWIENNEPRVIAVMQEDSVKKNVTWYFQDKKLLYTETRWTDKKTNKVRFQEKTYHEKGILFACLNSENRFIDANSKEFRTLDRDLQNYSQALLEQTRDAALHDGTE